MCLGLWLVVLVRRLCCCLPDRVRPRPGFGTRAPREDTSGLCTRLDPGGSIVDGLASGGVHHRRGLCRSLRVAPADLRPGTRPAHPGPAHRRMSAVAFQVPGELGGGGPGCRGLGRGGSSSPSSSGTCGPPCRSPRTPGAGAARGRPSGVPDHFLGAAAGDGRQTDRVPLPGADTGGCRPPTCSPGLLVAGARAGPGQDHETPGPAARGWWRRVLSARPRQAWRALLTHGRVRTASRPTHPRPRGRRAAGARRYPQGSVRGTELSPDEKCQSASSGGGRRHPARCASCSSRTPGYSGPPAHQYRPGMAGIKQNGILGQLLRDS